MVKVFSLTAVSTLVKMLTGFISVKIISTLIGPAGVALLGQLTNFSTIFLTFSNGGINNGVTKYVAEYSPHDSEKVGRVIHAATRITGTLSLLAGIVLCLGSGFFALRILHDEKYSPIILVFGFTLIFYSFNSLLLAILNGFKEFNTLILINILSSVLGLVFSATLAYFWSVYGALLSAVTVESVVFCITLKFALKNPRIRQFSFFGPFRTEFGRKLAGYSLMTIVSTLAIPLTQLILRDRIVVSSSLNEAGLWEGMNRISAMYLYVITTSLSLYYLPRLAEIKHTPELRTEILGTYKLLIPPLLLASVLIFFCRDLIIQILFNSNFSGMNRLFVFQLTGDFFKICSWLIAYLMVARSMTSIYIATEILSNLTYIALATWFIHVYGPVGANMAYALNYVLYFGTMLLLFRGLLFKNRTIR